MLPYTATRIFSLSQLQAYWRQNPLLTTILREMETYYRPFPLIHTALKQAGIRTTWVEPSCSHTAQREPVILPLLLKVPNWHQESGAKVATPPSLNFFSLLRLWTPFTIEIDYNSTTLEIILIRKCRVRLCSASCSGITKKVLITENKTATG